MKIPNHKFRNCRPAAALILTLIVLIVLTVITTELSIHVARTKRRQQYMIEYQQCRYACDSALKYIRTEIATENFRTPVREGYPDFSDTGLLDQQWYEKSIRFWLETAEPDKIEKVKKDTYQEDPLFSEPPEDLSISEIIKKFLQRVETDPNQLMAEAGQLQIDPNQVEIPGPYGVGIEWPMAMEPVEFSIGPVDVTITVEDENAKLPLGWAMIAGKKEDLETAEAAVTSFCERMQMDADQIEDFFASLEDVKKLKTFSVTGNTLFQLSDMEDSYQRNKKKTKDMQQNAKKLDQDLAIITDFGKLYRSSLIDLRDFRYPLPDTGERIETPLKYVSTWGTRRININTAPRQVLEAAFMFGSTEAIDMAQTVIERRIEKPFRNVRELQDLMFEHKEELKKVYPYIDIRSAIFQIKIKCVYGNARCTAVTAVFKDNRKVKPLAVFYDR